MRLSIVILCTLSLMVAEAPGFTHQMGWFSFGSSTNTTNQVTVTNATNTNNNNTILTQLSNNITTNDTTTNNSTKSTSTGTSSSSYSSYLSLLNPFYWLSGPSSHSTNTTISNLSPLSRLSSRRNQLDDNTRRMDAADEPTTGPFNSNRINPLTTTTIAPAIQEVPIKRNNVGGTSGQSANLQPRLLTSQHQQFNSTNVNVTSRPVATIKATLVTNPSSMRSSYMLNNQNGSAISNMFTTSRPSMSRSSIGGSDLDTHSLIRQKTPKMMFIRRNGHNHLVHNNQHQIPTVVNQTTSVSSATTSASTGIGSGSLATSAVVSSSPTSSEATNTNQNPLILVVMPSPIASEHELATTTTTNNNNKVIAHEHNGSTMATRKLEH